MKYVVYREKQSIMEIKRTGSHELEIIQTNLQDGSTSSLTMTKEQFYHIERFLKLGIHQT